MQVAAYDANGCPIHAETANDATSVHLQLHHCVNCGSDELIATLQAIIRRLREAEWVSNIRCWTPGCKVCAEKKVDWDAETERKCRGEGI